MGGSWSFALMGYGDLWNTHRQLFRRFFDPSAVDQFDDKIHKAVNVFLHRLSETPERFLKHAHLYVGFRSTSYNLGLTVWTSTGKSYRIFDFIGRVRGEY